MALTDKLTAIADAIRGKTGKTDELTLDQMPTEIAGISGGEDIPDGTEVTFGWEDTSDDNMFYYNGVLLPGISAEIQSNFPNLILMQNEDTGGYYLSGAPSGYNWYLGTWDTLRDVLVVSEEVTITHYGVNSTGLAWELTGRWKSQGAYSKTSLIWSNNDIPNGSATATTIYFEGSAPVKQDISMYPVEREEKYSITSEDLNDLAYAIQQKTEDYSLLTVDQMASEIAGIKSGGGSAQFSTITLSEKIIRPSTIGDMTGASVMVTAVGAEVPIAYWVSSVADADYGFSATGSYYANEAAPGLIYESKNYRENSSYAICRVNFKALVDSTITLRCVNYSQASYDYGIISEIDTELSLSSTADTTGVFKSFKGESSSTYVDLSMDVPAGEHFIHIKYIKNNSTHENNDTLRFAVIL